MPASYWSLCIFASPIHNFMPMQKKVKLFKLFLRGHNFALENRNLHLVTRMWCQVKIEEK